MAVAGVLPTASIRVEDTIGNAYQINHPLVIIKPQPWSTMVAVLKTEMYAPVGVEVQPRTIVQAVVFGRQDCPFRRLVHLSY
jgi:hypothetical protein